MLTIKQIAEISTAIVKIDELKEQRAEIYNLKGEANENIARLDAEHGTEYFEAVDEYLEYSRKERHLTNRIKSSYQKFCFAYYETLTAFGVIEKMNAGSYQSAYETMVWEFRSQLNIFE